MGLWEEELHGFRSIIYHRVPTSSGNHGKPGKSPKNFHVWKKSWNLKKNLIIMEKSWNFVKSPVARKLAVRHTKLVCLTASFLATGGFKILLISKYMHCLQTCLSKCITVVSFRIYLSVVKVPLKGHALKTHGNYIVDHGKSRKNHGIVF